MFDSTDDRLKLLPRVVCPHSFWYLYSMITWYLGFRPQNNEYKVKGLAAHGTPQLLDEVSRLARTDSAGGST